MKIKLLSALLLATLLNTNSFAEDSETGQQVFQQHCTPCHAPGTKHTGTMQLTLTRGEAFGVLEERDNLVDAYVKTIVRIGLNGMPAFKPTIITDQQLDAVAQYLSN